MIKFDHVALPKLANSIYRHKVLITYIDDTIKCHVHTSSSCMRVSRMCL